MKPPYTEFTYMDAIIMAVIFPIMYLVYAYMVNSTFSAIMNVILFVIFIYDEWSYNIKYRLWKPFLKKTKV